MCRRGTRRGRGDSTDAWSAREAGCDGDGSCDGAGDTETAPQTGYYIDTADADADCATCYDRRTFAADDGPTDSHNATRDNDDVCDATRRSYLPVTLRRFALWNVIFWSLQQPLVVVWYFTAHDSFVNGAGLLYLSSISVAALWLSSLSWWQSARVEETALTVDELVDNTNLEPT